MARDPGAKTIYKVAEQFSDRCLKRGHSLLWPDDPVWTVENLVALREAFIDNPDTGKGSFFEKLRKQIADCSEGVHQIAADVVALYFLPVWRPKAGLAVKIGSVRQVISWKLAQKPPSLDLLEQAFSEEGLLNPGPYYMIGRPWQVAFYLRFAEELLRSATNPEDVAGCKKLADSVGTSLASDTSAARHIILHLLFPERFEDILTNDKEAIAKAFSRYAGGATDVDDALYNIRQELERQKKGRYISFYNDEEIRGQWQDGDGGDGGDKVLAKIAELLETLTLDDPNVVRDSWWREHVKKVTRPFLERIAQEVGASETKYHTGGDAARKRTSFDRVHFPLGDRDKLWHHGGPEAFVSVGYEDEPQSQPNLERCLTWGVDASPNVESLDRARERFRELLPDGFEMRDVEGMKTAPWPGRYLVGFKDVPAEELRFRNSADLVAEIARDIGAVISEAGGPVKVTPMGGGEAATSRLNELAGVTHMSPYELREIETLLREKKQIIFEGPPGCGKTYVGELFGRYFTGNPLHGEREDNLEIVQFHQSYGYEDFVQGIRPETDENSGQIRYHVRPGIFMRFCEIARYEANKDRNFVLVIDEINRGNISRIFGELLLVLEYRDKRMNARLPYSGDPFSVPENVFIIGTMNTTDRSLAQIDYALRRRFYFYRLMPTKDRSAPVLESWLREAGLTDDKRHRVLDVFIALNEKIQQELGEHFQVGHSYFMNAEVGSEEGLQRIWDRAIMPLLEEYFYNRRDRGSFLADFDVRKLTGGAPVESVASSETGDAES